MSMHYEHLVNTSNAFYCGHSLPSSNSNGNSTYGYHVLSSELKVSVLETAVGSQIPQHIMDSLVAREMDSRQNNQNQSSRRLVVCSFGGFQFSTAFLIH